MVSVGVLLLLAGVWVVSVKTGKKDGDGEGKKGESGAWTTEPEGMEMDEDEDAGETTDEDEPGALSFRYLLSFAPLILLLLYSVPSSRLLYRSGRCLSRLRHPPRRLSSPPSLPPPSEPPSSFHISFFRIDARPPNST
jgi:hypothetical protein